MTIRIEAEGRWGGGGRGGRRGGRGSKVSQPFRILRGIGRENLRYIYRERERERLRVRMCMRVCDLLSP